MARGEGEDRWMMCSRSRISVNRCVGWGMCGFSARDDGFDCRIFVFLNVGLVDCEPE